MKRLLIAAAFATLALSATAAAIACDEAPDTEKTMRGLWCLTDELLSRNAKCPNGSAVEITRTGFKQKHRHCQLLGVREETRDWLLECGKPGQTQDMDAITWAFRWRGKALYEIIERPDWDH